jgi:hypothetical protein
VEEEAHESEPKKLTNDFDKKVMEESIIEELSRKFETISLANMKCRTQKGKEMYISVWCDSLGHQKCNCVELREAICKNVVYLDGFLICLNETRKLFGRARMKKIVEEEDAQHVDAMHYAATVGIRVGRENLQLIETRVGF